jgi:hypothetical protein
MLDEVGGAPRGQFVAPGAKRGRAKKPRNTVQRGLIGDADKNSANSGAFLTGGQICSANLTYGNPRNAAESPTVMTDPRTESEAYVLETVQIGQRMREARDNAGLSGNQVVERMREDYGRTVRRSQISAWEHGHHRCSEKTRSLLARLYGVQPGYFVQPSETNGNGA